MIRQGAHEIDKLLPPEIAAESRLAANRAEDRLRREGAERLLEGLSSPGVAAPPRAAPESGAAYREQQRRDMERLIRGTQ